MHNDYNIKQFVLKMLRCRDRALPAITSQQERIRGKRTRVLLSFDAHTVYNMVLPMVFACKEPKETLLNIHYCLLTLC